METGSKQSQAVRGSVITTVANNTNAWLQPTARSLVQGSLVLNHHYAITKGHDVITSVLYFHKITVVKDADVHKYIHWCNYLHYCLCSIAAVERRVCCHLVYTLWEVFTNVVEFCPWTKNKHEISIFCPSIIIGSQFVYAMDQAYSCAYFSPLT